MVTISNLGVEVGSMETEIIEPTHTNKNEDRIFRIGNGETEIQATVWGSDDNQNWSEERSETVAPYEYKIMVVGPHHAPYVKLTGKVTSVTGTGNVDGFLTYSEP